MIKASAIYLVLIISLIIAVLCSSLILYTYYTNFHLLQLDHQRKAVRNASSGANYLLMTSHKFQEGKQIIDLYGDGVDSVELEKKQWGAFELGVVKARAGKAKADKMFLSGGKSNEPALYLTDHTYPLTVSGSTLLKGDCYLPRAGVERGNLHGQHFTGKKYVDGQTLVSTYSLPELDAEKITVIKRLFHPEQNEYVTADLFENNIHRSFADTTVLLYSRSPIVLSGSYKGNVLVVSEQSIEVSSAAILEDVVLLAPAIHLHDNFSGSGQFFAQDSLVIGKNCMLSYPSVAGLIAVKRDKVTPVLRLEENTRFFGEIFSSIEKDLLVQPLIKLVPGVLVHGGVYSNGYLELRGKVEGSVFTNKFIIYSSSVHENHLLNAVIDITARMEEYVGSGLREKTDKSSIVKWLE